MNINLPIIIKSNKFKSFKIENSLNYKRDFIDWYLLINTDFSIENKSESFINRYFKTFKKKTEVIGLPDLVIKDQKDFEKIIVAKHGRFREDFILLLENELKVDYWDEFFRIVSYENFPISQINYTEVLAHCIKSGNLIEEKREEIKNIVNKLLLLTKEGKIKYSSDILEFVGNLIFHKDSYDNKWIVQSLDTLILYSEKNDTKMFNFQLDKITKVLHYLDFKDVKISKDFKNIIKGNLSIKRTPEVCYPFYFELNVQKYSQQNKGVYQILLTNSIVVLNLLKNYLEEDSDVITYDLKSEKSIIKISALTENLKVNQRLDYFIDLLLEKSKENFVLDRAIFEKDMINLFLKEDMKTNVKTEKVKKV